MNSSNQKKTNQKKDKHKMKKGTKILILILLGGAIGGIIGTQVSSYSYSAWLNKGKDFGLTNPLMLDLGVMKISLRVTFNLTIANLLGIMTTLGIFI